MDNGASSYRRFLEGDESAFDEIVDTLFHNVYCMKYVKEGIPVYAVSRRTVPYDYKLNYYLYFEIDGIWFRLISGGYYYPSENGILRAPVQWRHAYDYETDPMFAFSIKKQEKQSCLY